MGAGHQLKKLSQTRASNYHHVGPITKHRWIEYMPKHWSVYTLIFSTASLLVFCFLFYDMQAAPTSLLLHAGRQVGALKAQVGDSYYLFSSGTRLGPSQIIVGEGTPEGTNASSSSKEVQLAGNKSEQKVTLSTEELLLIREEFDEPEETSTPAKPLKEVVPESKESPKESETKARKVEEVEESTTESSSEENTSSEESTEDIDVADEEKVEEMIAAAGALAEEVLSSEEELVTDEACDWSKGKWVYDENYPIYQPNTCPWLDGGFRCVENGRPSSEFQKYRWQPSGCNLPRFDAKDMLERMRGSRMVFVGDSIGRNNWESMLCMLSQAVSNTSRVYEINDQPITKHSGFLIYKFEDYDCTVEYYRSPHLVPQGRGPPGRQDPRLRSTLKVDVMDWSNSKWKTADIVIFNTGHWWSFEKTVRGGNFFQEGQKVHVNMSVHEGLTRAMKTVARFVEKEMDPKKSQVFFRSYAPVHFKGGTWDHGGTCNADQKPLQKFPFVWEDRTPSPMISDVMATNVKHPINFMNITYLSDLRPDGHSSIYQRVPNSPRNHQDCSHWCLPGVPDTWNEILFATLLKNGQGKWGNSQEAKI